MFQALSGFFILFCAVYTYIDGAQTPNFIYYTTLILFSGGLAKWAQETAAVALSVVGVPLSAEAEKNIRDFGYSRGFAISWCIFVGIVLMALNYFPLVYFFGLRYA